VEGDLKFIAGWDTSERIGRRSVADLKFGRYSGARRACGVRENGFDGAGGRRRIREEKALASRLRENGFGGQAEGGR
jgi:hypothetical protein